MANVKIFTTNILNGLYTQRSVISCRKSPDIALARLAFVVKYTARVHCCDYAPVVIPGVAASTPNRVLQISLCPKIIATHNRIFDCD